MRERALERGGKDRKKAIELELPFSWHSRQQESRQSTFERESRRGKATATDKET